MIIQSLTYGILFILTFHEVYYLAQRTGIFRPLNYISSPEVREEFLEERKFLIGMSLCLGFACFISLVMFMIEYWQNNFAIINIAVIILTPPAIFLLPYYLGRKHPYSWQKDIKVPPLGIDLE